jgi:selenocysteine-specific elongation factor
MKSVIVGTAGHIDHGKTALVKALTGIDADRLEEEKRRGITIDIGFAHLELPSPDGEKLRLGFVDVPGHERFVRNMLAGVGGIDLVLLVIAADEGIKPQTLEHFEICRLLAVRRGITVLTKSDTVDAETLDVVRLEVEELLRGSFLDPANSPVAAVSSLNGAGLDQLKQHLAKVAAEVPAKDSAALARLPIDRVFTMKGFGTVVTGTLVAGTIRKEDELEVFPTRRRVRVRGVQVHGEAAEQAVAGQRTALNLAGVAVEELARGMTLAPRETFRATRRIDTRLSLLPGAKGLKHGGSVHFHAYTLETMAEVRLFDSKQIRPGDEQWVQLRLREPALLLPHDRFIVRQCSPVATIGGGFVLDPFPPPRAPRWPELASFLTTLTSGSAEQILTVLVNRRGVAGLPLKDVPAEMNLRMDDVERRAGRVSDLRRCGQVLVAGPQFRYVTKTLLEAVKQFHDRNPLSPGISREQLRDETSKTIHRQTRDRATVAPEVFQGAVHDLGCAKTLELAGDLVRLPGRGVVLKDEEAESKRVIEQAFASAGLQVPALHQVLAGLKVDKARAQKIVTLLLRDKILVKISEELVFHQSALANLRSRIAALKSKSTPGAAAKIDVGKFKEITGVSRKYAIPLLEYLDRERVTKRVGDARVIL